MHIQIAIIELDSTATSITATVTNTSTTTTTPITNLSSSSSENSSTNNSDNKNNVAHSITFVERVRNASQCVQSGDYATAIRLYTEALKLDPNNHILYGNRSAVYCQMGKFKKALQDAIKARELNPNWSKAYYRQGIALQVRENMRHYHY